LRSHYTYTFIFYSTFIAVWPFSLLAGLNVFIFPINVFIHRVQPVKNDTPYLNSEFDERLRGHVVVRVIVNAGFVKREYFGPRRGADEAMNAVERGHFDTGGQFVEI
jgi:hypothetical protein